jgi:hypothetical protein
VSIAVFLILVRWLVALGFKSPLRGPNVSFMLPACSPMRVYRC